MLRSPVRFWQGKIYHNRLPNHRRLTVAQRHEICDTLFLLLPAQAATVRLPQSCKAINLFGVIAENASPENVVENVHRDCHAMVDANIPKRTLCPEPGQTPLHSTSYSYLRTVFRVTSIPTQYSHSVSPSSRGTRKVSNSRRCHSNPKRMW